MSRKESNFLKIVSGGLLAALIGGIFLVPWSWATHKDLRGPIILDPTPRRDVPTRRPEGTKPDTSIPFDGTPKKVSGDKDFKLPETVIIKGAEFMVIEIGGKKTFMKIRDLTPEERLKHAKEESKKAADKSRKAENKTDEAVHRAREAEARARKAEAKAKEAAKKTKKAINKAIDAEPGSDEAKKAGEDVSKATKEWKKAEKEAKESKEEADTTKEEEKKARAEEKKTHAEEKKAWEEEDEAKKEAKKSGDTTPDDNLPIIQPKINF